MVVFGLLGLCACSRDAPKGEVLARVDGKEITVHDVEAERRAGSAGLPSDAILGRLVQRAVLDNAARARGLDQAPNIPSDMRRLRNELLAQEELAALGRSHLTPKEIASRVDEVDHQLSMRTFYIVRQLKVSPPELALKLAHETSPAAAEETLGQRALWMESLQVLDAAELPPDGRAKLDSTLASHAPVVARQGGDGMVMWVESRQAAPMSSAARAMLAQQMAARAASARAQADGMRQLQAAAKVTYQGGTQGASPDLRSSPAKAG